VTNGISRNLLWKAVVPLVLLSVGASRCPFGGAFGFALSLIGYAICLIFALSLGEFQGTTAGRIARIVLAAIGCLIQWAGTVAAATAVAGIYFARTHSTAYTAQIEIVMAVICAVIAPALLTFKGRSWMGWNGRTLARIWGYTDLLDTGCSPAHNFAMNLSEARSIFLRCRRTDAPAISAFELGGVA
jgi:hypothetical protein